MNKDNSKWFLMLIFISFSALFAICGGYVESDKLNGNLLLSIWKKTEEVTTMVETIEKDFKN